MPDHVQHDGATTTEFQPQLPIPSKDIPLMTAPSRRFMRLIVVAILVLGACASDGSSDADDGVSAAEAAAPATTLPVVEPVLDPADAPDPEIECLDLDAERCAVVNDINCLGFSEADCIRYREQERDHQRDIEPGAFAIGQVVEINADGPNPQRIDGLVDYPVGWKNNTDDAIVIEFLNGEPIEGMADTGEIAPGEEFLFEMTYARSIWYRIQGTEIEGILEVDNPQGPDVVFDDSVDP